MWRLGLLILLGISACQPAQKFEHTFVDLRDGQAYRIRRVGELEWMMENLRYAVDSSWCVPSDSSCTRYGRLYPWQIAKKACPPGWRLPSIGEWSRFVERLSPGWHETNGPQRAYEALEPLIQAAGFYQPWTGRFLGRDTAATYWASDRFGLSAAMGLVWSRVHRTVELTPLSAEAGHTCRCVRKPIEAH